MELDHILRETSSTKPQRCHESHGTKILIFHTAGSSSRRRLWAVWLDWAIYCTLGNCLQPIATIFLTKLPTFLAIFLKVSKSFLFRVKSFFGNFDRRLATFTGHTWVLVFLSVFMLSIFLCHLLASPEKIAMLFN